MSINTPHPFRTHLIVYMQIELSSVVALDITTYLNVSPIIRIHFGRFDTAFSTHCGCCCCSSRARTKVKTNQQKHRLYLLAARFCQPCRPPVTGSEPFLSKHALLHSDTDTIAQVARVVFIHYIYILLLVGRLCVRTQQKNKRKSLVAKPVTQLGWHNAFSFLRWLLFRMFYSLEWANSTLALYSSLSLSFNYSIALTQMRFQLLCILCVLQELTVLIDHRTERYIFWVFTISIIPLWCIHRLSARCVY